MRRVSLSRDDYDLFHQDITPLEFEFFVTHAGAFKRMWNEQVARLTAHVTWGSYTCPQFMCFE